jgi:hypothetical protein
VEHGHERGDPSASSGSKLPGGRCLTVVGTEGVVQDPTIDVAKLTEAAKAAGAEFKPVTVKTQRALALSFIKLVKEAGHWQDKAA